MGGGARYECAGGTKGDSNQDQGQRGSRPTSRVEVVVVVEKPTHDTGMKLKTSSWWVVRAEERALIRDRKHSHLPERLEFACEPMTLKLESECLPT